MIAIVDYGGNVRSVERACIAAGLSVCCTSDPEVVANATRVILPGVGHAGAIMQQLERTGLASAIKAAAARGAAVLGICVGAQLLLDRSEEGDAVCLGLIAGEARKLPSLHVEWARVMRVRQHPVVSTADAYFTHGYDLSPAQPQDRIAETAHAGAVFCSAVGRGSVVGTLFHPEKSGAAGVELLRRFGGWRP